MKRMIRSVIVILAATFWSTLSPAAENLRQDRSSLVIWVFLGFCALIVIAQLLPAIRSTRQIAKESGERTEESEVRIDGSK